MSPLMGLQETLADWPIGHFLLLLSAFFMTLLLIWYYCEKKKSLLEMERELRKTNVPASQYELLKLLKLLQTQLEKIEEQQKFLLKVTLRQHRTPSAFPVSKETNPSLHSL